MGATLSVRTLLVVLACASVLFGMRIPENIVAAGAILCTYLTFVTTRRLKYRSRIVLAIVVASAGSFATVAIRKHIVSEDSRIRVTTSLQLIALARSNYFANWNSPPVSCLYDNAGHAVHSWRPLILPLLSDATSDYNPNEPWNSVANQRCAATCPRLFRSALDDGSEQSCAGFVIIDPATDLGSIDGAYRRVFDELREQADGRLCIVEVSDSGISWIEPDDLRNSSYVRRAVTGMCHAIDQRGGLFALFDSDKGRLSGVLEANRNIVFIPVDW
jgi:hypothetical protein